MSGSLSLATPAAAQTVEQPDYPVIRKCFLAAEFLWHLKNVRFTRCKSGCSVQLGEFTMRTASQNIAKVFIESQKKRTSYISATQRKWRTENIVFFLNQKAGSPQNYLSANYVVSFRLITFLLNFAH